VRPTSEPEGSIAQTTQEWNNVSPVKQSYFHDEWVSKLTPLELDANEKVRHAARRGALEYVNHRAQVECNFFVHADAL
jgi:hypothetical protein